MVLRFTHQRLGGALQMKKLITTLLMLIGMLSMSPISGVIVTPAFAGNCGGHVTQEACEAAKWAADATPFSGPLAQTTQPMACVRVLTYNRTEMILVSGPDAQGPVLTSQRAAAGRFIQISDLPGKAGDVYVGEFCFPKSLIAGLRSITICNGDTPSKGFHHTLSLADDSASYLRRLQSTGHAGDFLSLLGEKVTYSNAIAGVYTSKLYRQMYGG